MIPSSIGLGGFISTGTDKYPLDKGERAVYIPPTMLRKHMIPSSIGLGGFISTGTHKYSLDNGERVVYIHQQCLETYDPYIYRAGRLHKHCHR